MKSSSLAAAILVLTAIDMVPLAAVFAQDYAGEAFMPHFENRYETEHFALKWTNRSVDSRDNIGDPQIIKETAGYLETAWAKYTALFGRHPYTPPGRDKIDVVFQDIDNYGVAYPPDGPIQFNAYAWVNESGIRQPTSAHELFHKMQYAYGYSTRWTPKRPYRWFTEGTAAWAEAFVWGRVSRRDKIDTLFRDAKLDLYEADYTAMPFWIYFVQGIDGLPNNHLMAKFFEKCEQLQNEKLAMDEVIKETYGSVDGFFRTFAKVRNNGFWNGAFGIAHKPIPGPDEKVIVHELNGIQRKGNRS